MNTFMGRALALALISFALLFCTCHRPGTINLSYDSEKPVLEYGANKLRNHLRASGKTPTHTVAIRMAPETELLSPEGFRIETGKDSILILGKTERGCLYGIMELIGQLGPDCDFSVLKAKQTDPAISFRAIKFNLPWAPYRPGPANDLHMETCRDLDFWEAFLDMMVENRFNALSLWSNHIFPFMIRAENYPEASPFSDQELVEWQSFWKELFRMARDRGIETYLVNWNIVVSESFAEAYGAGVHDDRSDLVIKYTKESVTQLINEYPDLTGLGVTLADWMGNWGEDLMTPPEREEWISKTFVEGMKQADRKVKFIHRAVLAGNPAEMRKVIDEAGLPDKTIVEVKFNWSHGHSTPRLSLTHSNDEGTIMRGFWDPTPENFFIAWTIRNEDFFVLRWGHPDFIREHIQTNHHSYVDGYFVGSEGYIPAADYSHADHPHRTWKYAFQKQWLFYQLWGRLLYNPQETNEQIVRAIENRYPGSSGSDLLEAYQLASGVPLHLASFYKSTWDFTLYSEGFLAPWTIGYDDSQSPFISLEELIRHETLDARYLSISDYTKMHGMKTEIQPGLITPPELATLLKSDGERALRLIKELRKNTDNLTLLSELDDLETWCHLGFYFADKLIAGVAFVQYRESGNQDEFNRSTRALENCIAHWENVVRLTEDRYKPMPYVSMGNAEQKWPEFTSFHWKDFRNEVKADLEYVLQHKR